MKNAVIMLLSVLCVWLGASVVRLAKYHYGSMLQACGKPDPLRLVQHDECFHRAFTRSSPLWNLYYGMKGH